jgi:DNA modification methylase
MIQYLVDNSKNLKEIFTNLKIPAPSLIISSPPYFDILNYEDNKDQIGYGQNIYQDYLNDIVSIFQNCYEISSENSTFWLIIDTYRRDGETRTLPFDINSEFKRKYHTNSWKLKEVIIWDKEKNLPWNGTGKFKNQFEYILFFSKSEDFVFNIDSVREIDDLKKWWKTYPERYNPDGKAPSNIWQFTNPLRGWGNGKQNHLCPFPFPLVEKIISIATNPGDLVLDPFAGSGSVLAISELMDRNAIGIDINAKYYSLFKNEVQHGAKEYWEKRTKEINQNRQNILQFKKTNLKLRKLKSISNICSHLNTINDSEFIYLAIDNLNSKTINLLVVSNRIVDLTIENEKISDLLRQTKVKVDVNIINEKTAKSEFKGITLYKYKYDRFYSYTTTTRIKNIVTRKASDCFTYFYTDISVKIE